MSPLPNDYSNKKKTISIVTPSLNQGKYIEETINSVISQQGDFYIDYVIIDGGSTDNSIEIIRKYDSLINEDKWERRCLGIELTWVSEKDYGQTHAINKGFKRAKGDIVSWINSDDMYCSGAFSAVFQHFSQHSDDDFVFGDGDVIDEAGKVQWEWLSRPYNLKLLKSYHFLWNDFTNYIMQQSTFWKRRVFDKIGFLDDLFHYAMDIEYWIRAGECGLRLTHIPVKLGKFRMIQGTKSLSSQTAFWPESLEIFRRYNGAKAMKPFFVYYLFNEGLNYGHDIDYVLNQKKLISQKWSKLSKGEQNCLKKLSEKAYYLACLKLANDAFLCGERKRAKFIYEKVINKNPALILHYLSFIYLLKSIVGKKISETFIKARLKLIQEYRRRRYLYRYSTVERKKKHISDMSINKLIKKYGTNREFTKLYIDHMNRNFKNHPQFDLYIDSELGSLKRSIKTMDSLCQLYKNSKLFLNKECLDIGCSSGNALIAFVEKGAAKATGIDIEKGRIKTASINVGACPRRMNNKIQIFNDDIQNVNLIEKIGQFDIIFCTDVLEHVENPDQAVEQICRLLKDTEEAFAYLSLRNYLHPRNILHEPHYDLPGMILLPYELAKQYFDIVKGNNSKEEYGVYHWKSFFDYQNMFNNFGKRCMLHNSFDSKTSAIIASIEEEAKEILCNFNDFWGKQDLDTQLKKDILHYINDYLVVMKSLISKYNSTNDKDLLERIYLNYVIYDIELIITHNNIQAIRYCGADQQPSGQARVRSRSAGWLLI